MRVALTFVLAFMFALPVTAQATDSERRMNRIVVTALPPWMGTTYANAYTLRPAGFERPGFGAMRFTFTPVIVDSDGQLMIDSEKRQSKSIETLIPMRAPADTTPDSARGFYTQDIAMRSGDYVLSEITFVPFDASAAKPLSYCLSKGTFRFDIYGQDTLFMGSWPVDYPPPSEHARKTHAPLAALQPNGTSMRGWRSTSRNLATFDPVATTFPVTKGVCSEDSHHVSAWQAPADES